MATGRSSNEKKIKFQKKEFSIISLNYFNIIGEFFDLLSPLAFLVRDIMISWSGTNDTVP